MLISLQDTGFLSKACRAIKNLSAQHRHIPHYEHIQTEQRSWNPQNSTIKLVSPNVSVFKKKSDSRGRNWRRHWHIADVPDRRSTGTPEMMQPQDAEGFLEKLQVAKAARACSSYGRVCMDVCALVVSSRTDERGQDRKQESDIK